MAFETMKAAIYTLLDEIQKRPDDRHILQEQLREKLAELSAMGLPVPEDLKRLEADLEDDSIADPFTDRSGG